MKSNILYPQTQHLTFFNIFFFNDTATTEIYTLSLHDALPIYDMQVCARYKVPIVITSLGARTDINDAVHAWGGVVLHDIINNSFAKKAIEKGADGLIAVAAGAGGHAGVKSPFALIAEIRQWFDG